MDLTMVGSRSGANAIAVWMILFSYGYYWFEKINTLLLRTDWFIKQLNILNIEYFRDIYMNIVIIKSKYVPESLAHKYGLVPETHNGYNTFV